MAENIINFLLKIIPALKKIVCKKIAIMIEAQSIIFNPKKKINKNSFSNNAGWKENIPILIKYPKAFDKKYVWIPNIKIPTKLLIKPKYFAPLIPKEDLSKTTNGKPSFWEGLPIQFEKK